MDVFRKSAFLLLVLFLLQWSFFVCYGEDDSDNVAAPMEKGEQEALYSTIQDFVGKWWNGSDLYPDPCGWTPIQGVACDISGDGFWYVTSLTFGPVHENSLDCAENVGFSPHLFNLSHLKSLSFFNCFLSSHHHRRILIPNEKWEALDDTLESLEFRSNPGLVGHIPSVFGSLKNLQSLVLTGNGLNGEIPENIGGLSRLKRLVLVQNRLTGRIPYSFGSLSDLLILDLSRNVLSGSLPSTLGALASLLKLDLSYNNLSGNVPKELGNLKNLTLLDLSFNQFSDGMPDSVQEMSSLEELVLSSNPIGGDLVRFQWRNLRELMLLDLSNMSLTGRIPDAISELTRLRFLGLNDNNLVGEIPSRIGDLPNISAIYLNGNNLTGEMKFSEWFYGKMGRRFGAWNNTNLCYPIELLSRKNVPFGVKPCQQETTTTSTLQKSVNLGEKNPIISSSMGVSCFGKLCCIVLLIQLFMMALIVEDKY